MTADDRIRHAFNAGYIAASQAIRNGTINDAWQHYITSAVPFKDNDTSLLCFCRKNPCTCIVTELPASKGKICPEDGRVCTWGVCEGNACGNREP